MNYDPALVENRILIYHTEKHGRYKKDYECNSKTSSD